MASETDPRRANGGTGSYAAVLGHPIHPMLVPITIGMYVAATCADLALARTGSPFWALGASWLLLGTLISGAVAVVPGVIDFVMIDRAQRLHSAWAHAGGNMLFLALVAVNYSWRPMGSAPGTRGFVLTLVGLALLLLTGWLGGEMSYRRGIGVACDLGSPPESGEA